jgi:hypothetical protein
MVDAEEVQDGGVHVVAGGHPASDLGR